MGSDRKVRLRPHHLMCIHGFQGYGYSSSYVENFWRQLERLKNESETLIEVSFGPDQICSACPHLLDAQTCKEEEKIQPLDRAYIQNLELKNGETMTLDELKKRISQKMTAAIFESSCAPCEWKKLGVCLKALSQMIDVSNKLKVVIFFIFIIQALFGSIIFKTDLLASEVQSVTKARSVQALEEELIIDKTKRLTVFRKITQNIEKKEYKLALEALKSLEKNSRYQEYFHFLSAQAEIGRMKTAIDQKKYANALLSGDQASYHLSQMMISPNLSQDLSSLLLKRGQYLMGETELDLAKCSLKLNKRSKAIQYYERAFQRLSNLNLLVVVTKTAIVNYALLCEKNKNEICTSWILKLSPLVAKTDDAKILERIVAFKKPSIERSISVPYKIDLDLEAFGKGFAA